eukprot:5423618-Pleurochrysis_carterae.AAC.1
MSNASRSRVRAVRVSSQADIDEILQSSSTRISYGDQANRGAVETPLTVADACGTPSNQRMLCLLDPFRDGFVLCRTRHLDRSSRRRPSSPTTTRSIWTTRRCCLCLRSVRVHRLPSLYSGHS